MSDPKATAIEIERLHREIARLNDENERLNFDYERLAARKLTDEVDAERALADELYAALERVTSGLGTTVDQDIVQALAHYRKARS